jgi:hypothetical protein
MQKRPAGATALSLAFLGYGALTLLAFPIGWYRRVSDFQALDVIAAALVAVLAILTGANIWRLSPVAQWTLLSWASVLVLFNVNLFLSFGSTARFGMAIGIAGLIFVVALLYRYVGRVCAPAA